MQKQTQTQSNWPTLSPLQALQRLNAIAGTEELIVEGFIYSLDCIGEEDPAFCFPIAFRKETDEQWTPAGDFYDEITEETVWVE
jgi:hypothetical protein